MTNVEPNSLKYELHHKTQSLDWDCGISCILMVLPTKKRQFLTRNLLTICAEEGFGESTWTIDLCYLLKRLKIPHVYLTTVLGVNEGYDKNRYYDNILSLDQERVNYRFKNAEQFGIKIKNEVIQDEAMIEHLAHHGPIILLTNSAYLTCDVCKSKKLSNELRQIFPIDTDYIGHYVVLCGYNKTLNKFLYRDPSKSPQICRISFKQLSLGRKAFGTDCDTILLFNKV